jgi:DNA-binding NarL/FixJ family response regulator
MKILIIENERRTAAKAAEILENEIDNVSIHICLSGMEGLKTLKRKSFDLVISESRLADMSGFELLRGMAEIGGRWPVIILSMPEGTGKAIRFVRKGVYDFIVKDADFPQSLPRAAQRALDLSYVFNEKSDIVETSIKTERRRERARIAHVLNHEINDPLMTIIGNLQLLLSRTGIEQKEFREKLLLIEDSARRIARVMAYFADSNSERIPENSGEDSLKDKAPIVS